MLRFARRLGVRHASIVFAALFTVGLMATSAFAQLPDDFCPVGDCSGPGQSIGGDEPDPDPQPPAVPNNGGSTGANNSSAGPGASGQDGPDVSSDLSGSDGADSDQGRPGRAGVGQPGRSGNPSPTPSVRTPSPAGGRTIPNSRPPLPGSRTVQAAGAPLLPFEVIPSPFPSLEPSPSPSPSPSPTDLVAAIDNIDPEPVADEGGSLVPLMLVLAGAAMLFVYFRSRKRASRRGMGPGRFSGNRTLR